MTYRLSKILRTKPSRTHKERGSFLSALSLRVIATTSTLLACVALGQTPPYSYNRTITINHTKVPNTDQPNFPFLFNTTDPTLKSVGNGGHVNSASGYDIILTSDATGTQKLNHEIESYNPSTGQFIAWVRIPNLSHTTDTVIYLFYGNSSITSSQENKTGVWDSNYAGVWHLPNGSTLSANDSTSNGNTGTVGSVAAIAGQIDGAASFSGSDPPQSLPSAAPRKTSAAT